MNNALNKHTLKDSKDKEVKTNRKTVKNYLLFKNISSNKQKTSLGNGTTT